MDCCVASLGVDLFWSCAAAWLLFVRAGFFLLQVLFDLPDFMIVSAYTLLAVVWAEAFLQVIRSCAVVVAVIVAAAAAATTRGRGCARGCARGCVYRVVIFVTLCRCPPLLYARSGRHYSCPSLP